jgi:hypothetical protein
MACVSIAAALMLVGCNRPGPSTQPGADESLPGPGLTRGEGDSATAIGTLVYKRAKGGYFALVDASAGTTVAPDARVVAVILDSDGGRGGSELAPLVGAYVEFEGTLLKGTPPEGQLQLGTDSYRILKEAPKR